MGCAMCTWRSWLRAPDDGGLTRLTLFASSPNVREGKEPRCGDEDEVLLLLLHS
jgi:hypothetical protein